MFHETLKKYLITKLSNILKITTLMILVH